ncbi:outer membrane protein assembly factor BamB family protein [Wenyingzhuangia sp. IMCC45533]
MKTFFCFFYLFFNILFTTQASSKNISKGAYSIETGMTILKVRTAKNKTKKYIVAASYEGTILGYEYNGKQLWKNPLSGFMVHDLWCDDINNDGKDEILVANADGAVYCLNSKGNLLWKQQISQIPMYTVTTIKKDNISYVVCGGFDLNIYYLDANNGKIVKEIPSATYSLQKPWNWAKSNYLPPNNRHYANFLRTITTPDGKPVLVLHGNDNHMQNFGYLYFFNALESKPFKSVEIKALKKTSRTPIGELRFAYHNNQLEIILGNSCHQSDAAFFSYKLDFPLENAQVTNNFHPIKNLGFGYVVTQTELIKDQGVSKYLSRVGRTLVLINENLDIASEERFTSKYSYYDMWKDGENIIMGSVQSGGSAIHILNTNHPNWKTAYTQIPPSKKIEAILRNTDLVRSQIETYKKPEEERSPREVYFMTEDLKSPIAQTVSSYISENYNSPVFLNSKWMKHVEQWDRSTMDNKKYQKKRDRRKKYDWTQEQCLNFISKLYAKDSKGAAYWGGHGNDPYMFQLSTTKKALDNANGKKTVLIYPELEDHTENMEFVLDDLLYPLLDYSKLRNGHIFLRTKHSFWQGNIYLPMWEKVLDGNYANVFVPAMEETTDKAMDISIAGRTGLWASGVVNNWGTRAINDNASFDRSRQFSNQRLPNHFLRQLIYHLANGATYVNNLATDNEYMSVLWNLIAKGALFVPKPHEVLSYSPVHIGMKVPDEHYMNESSNLKWSTYYDKEFENNNPFAFSRNNATYMAAQNTAWDFSSIASGTKDRRQNFLPKYPNGLVLITPPQQGVFAKNEVSRGKLVNHLHPLYKGITKGYVTDGRYYFSEDGTQKFTADTYAKVIKDDIEQLSKKLPIKVEGEVAWVVAQTSPKHLRITIIDGGYLNPSKKLATVKIQTSKAVKMIDILDKTEFDISNPSNVSISIPCGGFRFIDVALSEPLVP